MNAHTPGPWVVDRRFCILGPDKWLIAAVKKERLAAEANALLIAAAPELLAALQEAARQIEYLHKKFEQTGDSAVALMRARVAIAKATS